jgi:ATP dependent DNA ligase domain
MPATASQGEDPSVHPMQPTQVKQPFHRDGWVYEEMIDGCRMLAYKKGGRTVRLESRNGVDHTRRFPELAAAVAALPSRTLMLDGVVAIYDQKLRSRFEWLREPDPNVVATPPCSCTTTRRSCVSCTTGSTTVRQRPHLACMTHKGWDVQLTA